MLLLPRNAYYRKSWLSHHGKILEKVIKSKWVEKANQYRYSNMAQKRSQIKTSEDREEYYILIKRKLNEVCALNTRSLSF